MALWKKRDDDVSDKEWNRWKGAEKAGRLLSDGKKPPVTRGKWKGTNRWPGQGMSDSGTTPPERKKRKGGLW